MNKIAKGTEVWLFEGWNDRSTIAVSRMVIQSFGEKQATATYVIDGKFKKRFIYSNNYGNIVPVADLPDPTAEGLRRAAIYREENIASNRNIVHWYHDDSRADDLGYAEAMKKDCERIIAEQPKLISL